MPFGIVVAAWPCANKGQTQRVLCFAPTLIELVADIKMICVSVCVCVCASIVFDTGIDFDSNIQSYKILF